MHEALSRDRGLDTAWFLYFVHYKLQNWLFPTYPYTHTKEFDLDQALLGSKDLGFMYLES